MSDERVQRAWLDEIAQWDVNAQDHLQRMIARKAAMAEKRAYLHKVAVEEADDDYADSGSLSEDEEAERSGRPR